MKPAIRKQLKEYFQVFAIVLIASLFIRYFFIDIYFVPSHSMRPGLESGQNLLVLKSPWTQNPSIERGDIVVLRDARDPDLRFARRVLALENDRIELKQGRAILNGVALEPVLNSKMASCSEEKIPQSNRRYEICWEQPVLEDFGPEIVPPGSLFAVGDFRTQLAIDQRGRKTWGIFRKADIIGRAKGVK